jgi:hypothetical protein
LFDVKGGVRGGKRLGVAGSSESRLFGAVEGRIGESG